MTTTQQKIAYIREKCIEANKEKPWYSTLVSNGEEFSDEIPVRLADVLLAVNMPVKFYTRVPTVKIELSKLLFLWKLNADDLTLQSEETLDFISSILGYQG